ncbi:MAG: biotin/lipoyl-containing protein, partial [Stellaceae bacterium]
MPIDVLMPALSPTMTEGKIAKWHKKEGDPVKAGDILAEIETDKATMEIEAVDEGTFAKIIVPEGTEHVAVNLPIAVIAGEDESVDDVAKAAPAAPAPKPSTPAQEAPVEEVAKTKAPSPAPEAAPAPPSRAAAAAQPEWTGATTKLTVREALRDAMA